LKRYAHPINHQFINFEALRTRFLVIRASFGRHGGEATMIRALLGHHPGKVWMMRASPARHGGEATMIKKIDFL
jgi:hypothetical protein